MKIAVCHLPNVPCQMLFVSFNVDEGEVLMTSKCGHARQSKICNLKLQFVCDFAKLRLDSDVGVQAVVLSTSSKLDTPFTANQTFNSGNPEIKYSACMLLLMLETFSHPTSTFNSHYI